MGDRGVFLGGLGCELLLLRTPLATAQLRDQIKGCRVLVLSDFQSFREYVRIVLAGSQFSRDPPDALAIPFRIVFMPATVYYPELLSVHSFEELQKVHCVWSAPVCLFPANEALTDCRNILFSDIPNQFVREKWGPDQCAAFWVWSYQLYLQLLQFLQC